MILAEQGSAHGLALQYRRASDRSMSHPLRFTQLWDDRSPFHSSIGSEAKHGNILKSFRVHLFKFCLYDYLCLLFIVTIDYISHVRASAGSVCFCDKRWR
jgi:hypothetical protein